MDSGTARSANPPAVACSLSGPELSDRSAEIRALARDGLLSMELGERQALLRFRADADISRRVSTIAEAERECCPFLTIALEELSDAVLLRVVAPDGAEETLRALAALFDAGAVAA